MDDPFGVHAHRQGTQLESDGSHQKGAIVDVLSWHLHVHLKILERRHIYTLAETLTELFDDHVSKIGQNTLNTRICGVETCKQRRQGLVLGLHQSDRNRDTPTHQLPLLFSIVPHESRIDGPPAVALIT